MTAFLALVRKDLLVFFQDRRAVLMTFVAPILIGSFFGYVFGGTSKSNNPGRITILVVNQEKGPVTAEVLSKLNAEPTLQVQPVELEDARQQVRRGRAPVAVVFPPDFGKQATSALFNAGEKPKLTIYSDPSHQVEANMLKGMLSGYVMQAVSKEAFSGNLGRTMVKDALGTIKQSAGQANDERSALTSLLESLDKYNTATEKTNGLATAKPQGLSMPFDTAEEKLTSRQGVEYNPYAHSFGGMAIQFILFMGIDVGIGMLMDKQRGLWTRFAAAPLSRWTLLGSRTVSATVISILVLAVVFAFARLLFNVKIEGSLPGFVAVCAAFGLMTAAYGLLIAAIGKTPQAARGLSILATLLMVMLSGAWVPSFLFPGWLQQASKLVPARWAMDGLDGMSWRGLGWQEAVAPVLVLVAFAGVFGAVAALRFRWESK